MATLLLRLAAPLQSWGIDSKFETRGTSRAPTKSGVIGLLAAALGLRRDEAEAIRRLNQLRFGVRVDQEGRLLSDYQTVQKRGEKKQDNQNYVTARHYLADAVFLAGLESGDTALLEELEQAVRAPAFAPFLGRRSCPPSQPLCLGIREAGLSAALREEPLLIPAWRRRPQGWVRLLLDASPDEEGAVPQHDLPVSFSPFHRQFGYRGVREERIPVSDWEKPHDPFAEL